MKTWAVWLGSAVLLLVVLGLIGGLAWFKYKEIQTAMNAKAPPEQPISIMAETVKEISFRPSATMIGTVISPRSIVLSNEIAGTVSAIRFQPGQIVEKGQVLVELDSSVERAQLEAAKARKQIAESVYKRNREAASARAVTPSELDEATAKLSQAVAEVNELEAIINRKTLTAPFRAKIGLADTHEGQFLPSGFDIASLQGIEDYDFVDFMIPQSASGSVRVGDKVQLRVRSHDLTGEVIALDSRADPNSRNLKARAKVASQPELLLPGDSVKVLIEYGQRVNTVAVPPEALRSAPMGTFVYVIEPGAKGVLKAYERQVIPGPTVDGLLSIMSGLKAGSLVVAEGSFKLREGALVNIKTEVDNIPVGVNPPPVEEIAPSTL